MSGPERNVKARRGRTFMFGVTAIFWMGGCVALLAGCTCELQGCVTGVQLRGQVAQDLPGEVDFELCRNGECVVGTVAAQTAPGSTLCAQSTQPFESTVCLWWPKDGLRDLTGEVNLGRSHLPPKDGDLYTLRMSETATGQQLASVERRVSYDSYNPNGSGCPGECQTATLEL